MELQQYDSKRRTWTVRGTCPVTDANEVWSQNLNVVHSKNHYLHRICDRIRSGNEPYGTKMNADIWLGIYSLRGWANGPWGLGIRTLFSRNDLWFDDYELYTRENNLRSEQGPAIRGDEGFEDM